jgi:hypothetical protein
MSQAEQALNGFEAQKLNLLEQMLHIAQTQMTSIEQDRPDDLLRALKQRERVIRRIEMLDRQVKSDFPALGTAKTGDTPEIRRMIENILSIDRQCSAAADQKLLTYKSDIKSMNKTARQLGAYAQPFCASQGYFFDMKK